MLFSDSPRCRYGRSPLIEVICQLRFPAILSIGGEDPAQFQQSIRQEFPRYLSKVETLPPVLVDGGTPNARMEERPPVTNHHFVSADGLWKLNLTKDFIALSTLHYHHWEDFAFRLDKPLAAFLQCYAPAFFERAGLRYVNALSRRNLGLTDLLWDDLVQPPYLGVLGEPDVEESMVSRSSTDTELSLPDGCRAKLHAGPGLLQGGKKDPEVKFILDFDLSRSGQLSAVELPEALDALHTNAGDLFRGAVTPTLQAALQPLSLD